MKFAKCLEQWVRRLTRRFFWHLHGRFFLKQTCRHDRNTWNTDTPPSIHVYTSLGSALHVQVLNPGVQIFALIVRNITVATWARRLNKNQSIDRGAKWALKIYRILRAINVMTNVSCWLEESQSCSGMGLNVAKLLQAQRCIVANFCSDWVCIPKASSQLLLITVHICADIHFYT